MKDGFVEVKFKPIAGKEDEAGGVVWRLKDANNYYAARANALEDNVTIYHTINGRRTEKKRTSIAWRVRGSSRDSSITTRNSCSCPQATGRGRSRATRHENNQHRNRVDRNARFVAGRGNSAKRRRYP